MSLSHQSSLRKSDVRESNQPFSDATTVIRAGNGNYAQFWPGLPDQNATGGPWQSTEARLQFRWERHHAPNRPDFSNPSTNIQSGSFGLVTTAGAGRAMLFGLRLDF